jgi:transcriptional regulator GlxA family with amidase domain
VRDLPCPNIALLVESGATSSSVTVTLDLLRIAGRFEPDDAFRIDSFSGRGGMMPLTSGLSLQTRPLPKRLDAYDAVIVPGFFAAETPDLLDQLATIWQPAIICLRRSRAVPLIAASCYGTFVMAESGLLDGHAATTTWWQQGVFAQRYPRVRLNAGEGLVDDGSVVTAGAMTAHADLSLHVLRRLKGHTLARQVASIMLVDEGRASQRPFMTLQRHFDDPFADSAIAWMEDHLCESSAGSDLASALHVSYRTLHRRFCAVTGMAPLAYLQALRIEAAKAMMEETRMSVEQIAAKVGYQDGSSFRRLFARLTTVTPTEYRRRFRRE